MKTHNSIIHKAIYVKYSYGHIQCHDNETLLFQVSSLRVLIGKTRIIRIPKKRLNYIEVASDQFVVKNKRLNGRTTPTISVSYGKLVSVSQPSYFKIDLFPNIKMGVRENVISCLEKQLFPGRQSMTLAAVRRSSFLWYRLSIGTALFRKGCWP